MSKIRHKRSPCPVACTLDILGDKWTLLLIRDMLFGLSCVTEFCRSPAKIGTTILESSIGKMGMSHLGGPGWGGHRLVVCG